MAAQGETGRRSVRPLVAVAVAAVVFLAGMAARGALGADGEADAPRSLAETQPLALDRADDDGFARSRDGARRAALAYTASLAQALLYLEAEDAAVAIRAVAADASAATIVSKATADLRSAREPLAAGRGTTWWAVQPLASRIDAYDEDRARVSVWLVRVLSRQGVAVPQSSWVTESVDLVWERGDWRLWSSTSSPGPTPVLDGSDMPASAAELDDELRGFELVEHDGGSR